MKLTTPPIQKKRLKHTSSIQQQDYMQQSQQHLMILAF